MGQRKNEHIFSPTFAIRIYLPLCAFLHFHQASYHKYVWKNGCKCAPILMVSVIAQFHTPPRFSPPWAPKRRYGRLWSEKNLCLYRIPYPDPPPIVNSLTTLTDPSPKYSGVPRGAGVGVFNPPPKFGRPSKIVPNSTRFVKTVKNCWI